jgi:predicted nucleotide-binding protein
MARPTVFIGSSNESKSIGEYIEAQLEEDGIAQVNLWSQCFEFNVDNLGNLFAQMKASDFAILI